MHKDGLIFRDERLINWSPYLGSTVSDQEIDYISIDEPREISVPGTHNTVEVGWLYFIDYSLEDR